MSLSDMITAMKQLDGMAIETGFFDTARYPDGTTVAQVAHDNEVGVRANKKSGEKGQPPRPFMRYANMVGTRELGPVLNSVITKVAQGSLTADEAMGRIGLHFEGAIVDSIKNGKWIPNGRETIERKGFDKPLIDTGAMWQSVASRTTKRGG